MSNPQIRLTGEEVRFLLDLLGYNVTIPQVAREHGIMSEWPVSAHMQNIREKLRALRPLPPNYNNDTSETDLIVPEGL